MARVSPPVGVSLLAAEEDSAWDEVGPLEAHVGQRSWRRRAVVGAALALATFATVCLARWGGLRPTGGVAGVRVAAKDTQGLAVFGGSYIASQTCYGYSGGSCSLESCDPWRDSACQSGQCVCEASCAGSDGKCYRGQTNMMVATAFTLTNVKWPKYSMYFQEVSAFGQLKTTKAYSFMNLGKDKFSMFKMPGNTSRFFLGSVNYPDKVARVASTTGTAVSTHGFYSTDLEQGKGPDQLALAICYSRSKDALMVGSNDGSYWAYLHIGSWLVYGSSSKRSNVGDGGLWTPTPAFDQSQIDMLPPC